MVGTYDSLGKRPSARPQLGRPGTNEEALAGYTGLRTHEFVFNAGGNITATGIVPVASIGTVGTIPRQLTRQTEINALTNTTQPRTRLPLAMPLVVQYTAAAAPTGTHSIVIRISGTNQFGEPINADMAFAQAAGTASALTPTLDCFHTISGVAVISESNTSSADLAFVNFQFADTPTVGIPMRIRDITDVLAVTVDYRNGIVPAINSALDLGQNAGTRFSVNLKNHSVTLTMGGLAASDAAADFFGIHVRVRSSLGMDQGARSGDKFQKNY